MNSAILSVRLKVTFALTLVALCFGGLVTAQDERRAEVMSPDEYSRLWYHTRPYVLEWHTGKGGLLYFGVTHSFDPTDPQLRLMEKLWCSFHPDSVFIEDDPESNNLIKPADTRDEAIRGSAESGLAVFLAFRHGVPARTLRISQTDEIAALLKQGYSPEQIKLFYVLRGIAQDDGEEYQSTENYVENGLGGWSSVPELNGPPRTLTEFQASVSRLFPHLKDWREISPDWFDPLPSKRQTYLNLMSVQLAEAQDRYMVRLLVNEVKRGRWVFAVVGATHVVRQEPALRAALEVNQRNQAKAKAKPSSKP